jgi:hypothetical protein
MNRRNIILTGLPRSGITLTCHLLNKLPNIVALSEPYAPKMGDKLQGEEVLCDGLERVFRRMRRMIRTEKVAVSKQIGGAVPDNPFGGTKDTVTGLRKQLASKGRITIDKELSGDVLLVLKAPGLFTAILSNLVRRFPVYATIRNPLAVLASWNTLEGPARNLNFPLAEMYDEDLARNMAVEEDGIGRQLCLLSWFFARFRQELPESNVIRYEEIVESGGKALASIATAAGHLEDPLSSKNLNELYDRDEMRLLGCRLLEREGALWHFYSREEVEDLLCQLS